MMKNNGLTQNHKSRTGIANVHTEFLTVDAVLNFCAETCGVDAFALALIKVEKQLRKLFTHLIFQCQSFSSADVDSLRSTLNGFKDVYLELFPTTRCMVMRAARISSTMTQGQA